MNRGSAARTACAGLRAHARERRRGLTSLLLLALLLGSASCALVAGRLRLDEPEIRRVLLEQTPLGVDVATARARLAELRGFGRVVGGELEPSGVTAQRGGDWGWIGEQSFRVLLGSTRSQSFPFRTQVYADYAFDGEGRLVDVLVHKETDAP